MFRYNLFKTMHDFFQVSYGEPVAFPAVTFCNLNSVMKSRLELGGEELQAVISEAEDAQQQAATGERRKRKRSARRQGESDARKQKPNLLVHAEHNQQKPPTDNRNRISKQSVTNQQQSAAPREDHSKPQELKAVNVKQTARIRNITAADDDKSLEVLKRVKRGETPGKVLYYIVFHCVKCIMHSCAYILLLSILQSVRS